MRLFAAIDLPESVCGLLARCGRALGKALEIQARWVPSENLHLTLVFLGYAERDALPGIEDAIRRAATTIQPFRLRLAAGGVFPPSGRARVLWAGVDAMGEVTSLHQVLRRELEAGGVGGADASRFHPHITLARCRPPLSRALSARVPEMLHDLDSEPFDVAAVTLYESHTLPAGAHHVPLSRFDLGRAPGGSQ